MSSEEPVCLPIAQIRLDGGTQLRKKIDDALVEDQRGQLATVATHQEERIATRVCQDGKRRTFDALRQKASTRSTKRCGPPGSSIPG